MHTIETTAVVTLERTVTLTLPAEITPGMHDFVVTVGPLTEAVAPAPPALPFGLLPITVPMIDPNATFSREEIYGDAGR